jgi:hypothetical protein
MPKNNNTTTAMPQPYDPVPPYDLDDVEAAAADHTTQTQANTADLLSADDVGDRGEGSNVVEPRRGRGRGREGKLTEKECCDYAFMYFKTVVAGLVLITFFITWFSYLGRKK